MDVAFLEVLCALAGIQTEPEENTEPLDPDGILRLLHNSGSKIASVFRLVSPHDFYSSSKPFTNLQPATIRELVLDIRADQSYVLLKCLGAGSNKPHLIVVLAEDGKGDTTICLIYNHVHMTRSRKAEEEFPVGSCFLVKEPCLRQCANGNRAVVVYSPTDLVRVTRRHELFQETTSLGWTSSAGDPTTADGWKDRGNDEYGRGMFHFAMDAYLMGLQLEPRSVKLLFNLASTYFTTGFYELCLDRLAVVLQVEPDNQKALLLSGQGYYKLRNFETSLRYFKELSRVSPSHPKVKKNIQLCEKRMLEEKGSVDVFQLFQTRRNHAPLDFASYVGPLEVATIPGRGRGVIATRDLKAGTLVATEKALSATMVNSSAERFGMIGTDVGELLMETVNVVHKNPKTYGKIFNLASNNNDDVPSVVHEQRGSEYLDVDRILGIVNTNSFTLRSRSSGQKHSLLFYFCSFINHSCLPNCSKNNYNDVALIRTLTSVKKGEEITIAYKLDMGPRLTELPLRCFRCDCEYCQLERRDDVSLKQERARLSTMSKFCLDNLSALGIVNALEDTYGGRAKYTTALFYPYLQVAKSDYAMRLSEYEFMYYIDKALKCFGLSSGDLLRCAGDENAHLPQDAMLADDDPIFEVAMNVLWFKTDRAEQTLWFKVLLMLERVFTGGDKRMLIERYPQAAAYAHLVGP